MKKDQPEVRLSREDSEKAARELLRNVNSAMVASFKKHETISLEEFAARFQQAPWIAQNSRQFIWRMIEQNGGVDFFRRKFWGIDDALWEITATLRAMAMGGLTGRLGILSVGPPSSGKNAIVTYLFDELIEFAKPNGGDNGIGPGALYAIDGCPLSDSPLSLLPEARRAEVAQDTGLVVRGDICPVCRQRLMEEKKKDPSRPLSDIFQVRRMYPSRRPPSQGFGYLAFQDPRHQSLEPIFGGVDLQGVARYPADDPRTRSWNAESFNANRGVFFIDEAMRGDESQLRPLLWLLWDGFLRIENYGFVHLDTVIWMATNEPNLRDRLRDEHARALFDRLVMLRMPYTCVPSADEKILRSLIEKNDDVRSGRIHVGPFALHNCAVVDCLSRVEVEVKNDDDDDSEHNYRVGKVDIFERANDPNAPELDPGVVQHLRDANDGMGGLSYRDTTKSLLLQVSLHALRGKTCLTDYDALKARSTSVEHALRGVYSKKERKMFLEFCEQAYERWLRLARECVLEAQYGGSLQEEMREVFNRYRLILEGAAGGASIGEFDAPFIEQIETRVGYTATDVKQEREAFLDLARLAKGTGRVLAIEDMSENFRQAICDYLFDRRKQDLRVALLPDAPPALKDQVLEPFLARLQALKIPNGNSFCRVCALKAAREVLSC